ncbi:MAG: GTP-binding protein [Butyricicoccus sp.]
MKQKLILVGGFLGAGKTSLLWETAKTLEDKGIHVGMITNDQASGLVDTSFLESTKHMVREVSGSCFCCNFPGFEQAVRSLAAVPDIQVILAEPVGSCTDLSATILQPLKEHCTDAVEPMCLTVLADPVRLKELLHQKSGAADYIVSKQFEEADIILINKIDLLTADELAALTADTREKWPDAKVLAVSAKTGDGITAWLEEVERVQAGNHLAEVDYDIYAAGEAAYGWLNAEFTLSSPAEKASAQQLLNELGQRLDSQSIAVGHVKFQLLTESARYIGNLTGTLATANLRAYPRTSGQTGLIVNARAETTPETLEQLVREAVAAVFPNAAVSVMNTLIPGRPNPTYHYDTVYTSSPAIN